MPKRLFRKSTARVVDCDMCYHNSGMHVQQITTKEDNVNLFGTLMSRTMSNTFIKKEGFSSVVAANKCAKEGNHMKVK